METDPGSDGKRRETAVSARPFSARLFRLFFTLTIFIGECGGERSIEGAQQGPAPHARPAPVGPWPALAAVPAALCRAQT